MKRTDHDDFDGLAVGWALHALEPDEEQEFAEHLATCDRCQRLVRESEEALGDVAYDVELVDPPPRLIERIREATGAPELTGAPDPLTGDRPPPASAPVIELPRRSASRPPRWALPALAAAVMLIALLGWNVVLQSRVDESQRIAAQRQDVITELAESNTRAVLTDPDSRTVGYVVQRGSAIKVVTGGLAPNDRAKSTYVLWALQKSGEPPQAIGTFDVANASMEVRPVRGQPPVADTVSGFAVSREPGREVPQRPTVVVATGAVLS